MAPRREECEQKLPPPRPPENLCIANGDGTCMLHDSVTGKDSIVSDMNYVCKNISDYNRKEEYIDAILELLKR